VRGSEPQPAVAEVGRGIGVAEEGEVRVAVLDEVRREFGRGTVVLAPDRREIIDRRAREQHDRSPGHLQSADGVVADGAIHHHQPVDVEGEVAHHALRRGPSVGPQHEHALVRGDGVLLEPEHDLGDVAADEVREDQSDRSRRLPGQPARQSARLPAELGRRGEHPFPGGRRDALAVPHDTGHGRDRHPSQVRHGVDARSTAGHAGLPPGSRARPLSPQKREVRAYIT
jgi:hypothetical protein